MSDAQQLLHARWTTGRRPAAVVLMLGHLLCATKGRIAYAGINVWSSSGPAGVAVRAIAIDPAVPGALYVGADSGVFRGTYSAEQWQASSAGLPDTTTINALSIDPLTPSTLYAGLSSGGMFKSTDAGRSWTQTDLQYYFYSVTYLTSIFVNALVLNPRTPNVLYVGTQSWDVSQSTDGAASLTGWRRLRVGPLYESNSVTALAIDPLTPSTLYAGTDGSGVFKSTDGGDTWNTLNTAPSDGRINVLYIDPLTATTLYAGTNGRGLFKSADSGANWIAIATGLSGANVTSVAIDPEWPSALYAGTSPGGVFRSLNAGATWAAYNAGLPVTDGAFEVFTLAMTASEPRVLYAGSSAGVYAIQAASFVVDSTGDAPDEMPGDGVCATAAGTCTLRAAIDEANALPGGSTVEVPAGTYALPSFSLAITNDMTINGAGSKSTVLDAAGLTGSLLTVSSTARVSISGVTMRNANAGVFQGGAITNGGTLALTNSQLSGNRGGAGGILNTTRYNDSTNNRPSLTLMNCTVSGNHGGSSGGDVAAGGGIVNDGGTVIIANSTISGNDAYIADAGGIANRGTLTLTNSTVSNNSGDAAGGLSNGQSTNGDTLTVTSSTISGNGGALAGGFLNYSPGARFSDSIIAGNIVAGNAGGDCASAGGIVSSGHNLVGNADGCNWAAAAGDQIGTIAALVDPKLGPLQDNGGPTFTQALLTGSRAIDAGDDAVDGPTLNLTSDQRGLPRKSGAHVDIGAYEVQQTTGATPCAGDCNGDRQVTIDELLTLVNIALGDVAVSECDAGDRNHDNQITIEEILTAVNNALDGCPTP